MQKRVINLLNNGYLNQQEDLNHKVKRTLLNISYWLL